MSALKNILVVGVGSIGERHVRCFQQTGLADVSIVEIDPQLRTTIAARYDIARAFDSLDSALQNSFDAAVICTPAHLHIPQAIECARRGLALLIEKPLSIDLARVDELYRIANEKRIVVAVAYVLRCHPILASFREAILARRFGKPVQIVGVAGQHFPTFRPAYRTIYYANRASGGGAIQDALTHLLNAGQWLVGPITRLVADAEHLLLPDVSVEDTVHVLTRHGNVMGTYSLNQHQAANEFTVTVMCEHGSLRFEAHHHRYRWIAEPNSDWHDEPFAPIERDALFIEQAKRFLEALEGRPEVCSLADGEQTLRVILAVLQSVENRTWISLCDSRNPD